MYSDFHIHSHHSTDSNEHVENIVRKCISLGMKEFCFTDHNDFNWPVPGESFDLDAGAYFRELLPLKEKYSNIIKINIGVECGLVPENSNLNECFIKSHNFDFVIGSCHIVDGMDPYYPEFFKNRTDRDAFEKYFNELNRSVKSFSNFDVLGHIDYIVRYSPNRELNYSAFDYMDVISEVLTSIINSGKGIEINTSGLKSGLPFANPCLDILKMYKQLGGEIITIGSDAHDASFIGYEFDKAGSFLKKAGFTHYCTFQNRKPNFTPL